MDKKDLQNPALYTNRELSWLLFNKRVLSEARDKQLLLFERLKFLSITASNLDEFFMVRIGSLVDMIHAEYTKKDIAGMSAKEQLDALMEETHKFAALQYSTYNRMLLPQLRANGLNFVEHHEQLTERQAQYVDEYFEENVYPVLTPMAVDSSRPFPLIRNKTLNIGALVAKKGEKDTEIEFATVQVPSVLPRVVRIPAAKEGDTEVAVLLLEEIIERNISKLFLNYNVLCAHPFRITRNADLAIDEDEAEDLLLEIEKQIKKRTWGQAIRLEIEAAADRRLLKILCRELSVRKEDVFEIDGPLDLTFLMKVYGLEGFDELRAPKYTPAPVPEFDGTDNIFDVIKKGDVLMHHPYQSFVPVVDFIRQASKDPDEWEALCGVYAKFPLEELIIHPRLQIDYYSGTPRMETFARALEQIHVPLCYNGDICSVEDYKKVTAAFPAIDRIMIGRGLLENPGLVGEIKGNPPADKARLRAFHDEILEGCLDTFRAEKDVVFHLKEIWFYLTKAFPDREKYLKLIRKCQSLPEYKLIVQQIFS